MLNGREHQSPVHRIAFASAGAAGGPDEARRYAQWFDQFRATVGEREIVADRDAPFAARVEYTALGVFGLGRSSGSAIRVDRRREHASRDGIHRFVLTVNRARGTSQAHNDPRALVIAPGSVTLLDFSRPTLQICPAGYDNITLHMPRRVALAALPGVEDLVGVALPVRNDALRLLSRYADAILDDAGLCDAAVQAHAGQHLVDLAVLALGTDRDNAEVARHRGLRAARLAAVLRHIRRDYADPDLSPASVAAKIGISPRYLHTLLHETGASFAERVQELRLAKAFALLTAEVRVPHKISDAAYEAGFNDLSTFNRSFRRRYGLTPIAARSRGTRDPRVAKIR